MSVILRVLLLEDCLDTAQLILGQLDRPGYDYQATRVDNAPDLQVALDSQSWDMVIADYPLTDFNGLEALQIVRARCPDLPILFVSSALGEETAIAAIKAGANDYVMKDRLARLPIAAARELATAAARQAARRTEAALRESGDRLRLALENARHGMWDWDIRSGCVIRDENWHAILGYQTGELPAKVEAWKDVIHPDDRERVFAALQAHAQASTPLFDVDYRGRCKTGEWIWVNSRGRVQERDADGNPLRMVGTIHDITERKRSEKRLAQRADELARSNAELEQFGYVASHDLREPLRMVHSFCGLLRDRYGGKLDERADKYIHFAMDGAARMQRLVDDLLEYSRVGRSNEHAEIVQLDDAVQQAVANLAAAISESQATIELGPLPTVRGNSLRLQQVFQNLIGNALKFRGLVAPRVSVTAIRDGDTWQITVTDNGIGIDPKHFARLFVVFQRLHTKTEYPGTGIGLALCKRIIELHGGRIWLDSQPGRGTSVHFQLQQSREPFLNRTQLGAECVQLETAS